MSASCFIVGVLGLFVLTALGAAVAVADVGLLVYPLCYTSFRYDPGVYEIKQPTDPKYDPRYSVAGGMLWDRLEQRIAVEVYRAPWLGGFETSSSGRSEFCTEGNVATICVDGFSRYPRQLNDICVEFTPLPYNSRPDIYVNDERIQGLRYVIPRMVVATPIGDGFYSDTAALQIRWVGSRFIRIVAYADKNGNRVYDGDPSHSVLMEDLTVPTESKTWGGIKSIYGDR